MPANTKLTEHWERKLQNTSSADRIIFRATALKNVIFSPPVLKTSRWQGEVLAVCADDLSLMISPASLHVPKIFIPNPICLCLIFTCLATGTAHPSRDSCSPRDFPSRRQVWKYPPQAARPSTPPSCRAPQDPLAFLGGWSRNQGFPRG